MYHRWYEILAFRCFQNAAKSLIASAAGYEQMAIVTFVLLFASAGVMEHSGIKIPFFAFFAHDSKTTRRGTLEYVVGDGDCGALCIAIGVYPAMLYNLLLGFAIDVNHGGVYNAYSVTHVIPS